MLYVPYTCVLWTEQTVFIEGTDTRVHLPVRLSVCTPSVSPSTCVSVLWRVCVGCMDPNAWTRRMFHSTCFTIQFSHLCRPPFASSSSIQRSVSSSVSLLNSLCFSLHSLSSSSSLHLLPFVLPSPPPSVSYRSWQLPLTITQVGRHDNALMWSNINDLASFPRTHNLFIYWNDSKAARACIYAAALW